MGNFKLPPVSTLAGSSLKNYLAVFRNKRIDKEFRLKYFLTMLISAIGTPFLLWEKFRYNGQVKSFKFKEDPVFIIGHWRSGTTFLHNMLCQDPEAGYITTYQSLFPNHLGSKWLFKTFMKLNMPDERPADKVKLSINFPQEEEFALGNLHPYSYYHFWYFPQLAETYFEQFVRFEGVAEQVKQKWKSAYKKLLIKAHLNTGGSRLIIKNPVNMARISTLLNIFPDAKFIFIYRHPVHVYLSTFRFFTSLFPTLWFQSISREQIDRLILDTYAKMMQDYINQKSILDSHQLIELRYEEFVQNPIRHLKQLYARFGLTGWDIAEAHFKEYLTNNTGFKKNQYAITTEVIEKVRKNWGFAMHEWNYNDAL